MSAGLEGGAAAARDPAAPVTLTDRIAVEWAANTASVLLGSGGRRNALRRADWVALSDAFALIAAQPSVRCVTVRGRGGYFCSGSDLSMWAGADQEAVHATFADMEAAFEAVESFPVPVVAVVEGAAAGAGCQLALACDLRVVADGASLGMPTARLGIRPSSAFAARLITAVGAGRARELLYTGRMVSAEEALTCGLAERSAGVHELDRVVGDLVAAITAHSVDVLESTKKVVAALLPVSTHEVQAAGAPTVVPGVMQSALRVYAR